MPLTEVSTGGKTRIATSPTMMDEGVITFSGLVNTINRNECKETKMMRYKQTDGGRLAAGYKGRGGDCVNRAIAIATGLSYRTVRKALTELTIEMTGGLDRSAANGVSVPVSHAYLASLGWELILTKKSYLCDLPTKGTLIACLPRHKVSVIDGTLNDRWDSRKCKRTKCGSPTLEGYYQKEPAKSRKKR